MSVSTFLGLQTTLRGILAHQRAIDTTGHNISNVSTEGYSRQTANLQTAPALDLPGQSAFGQVAQLGTGVEVSTYRRIRDGFLDVQYRAQAMQLGYQGTGARALDQVELALAEPGDTGLQAQLSKLWSAWGDVANAPDGAASRQALLDQAAAVAETFRQIDAQLTTVAAQATAEYTAITGPGGEVAELATEVARLNEAIGQFVQMGDQPNDLMDRRDLLLDRLSALSQVSTTDVGNGMVRVDFGNVTLVNGTTINWPDPGFSTTTGKIGALSDVSRAGGTVDSFRGALNVAARTLADSVNTAYNGTFFSYTAGAEAGTLTVAVATPGAIVTSSDPAAPRGNDIALAVAGLRGGAADAAYSAFVSRVGNDLKDARRQEANVQALVDAVDGRRQSVSGVSLDEEMTNMVRYQRGFQASSRALSTMDDMLETLINRTGRVGL